MAAEAVGYLIGWSVLTASLLGFTLLRPQPYRFPRFMSFEALLTLIFWQAGSWFKDPFSVRQIFSWACLLGSVGLALQGFFLLRTRGNPEGDLEQTTSLITSGVYRYIRHPLYCSLALLGVGAFLKQLSWPGVVLLAAVLGGLDWTARIEERHNLERFGDPYLSYCEGTKRFIPFLY